ncbi:MAG: peptidase MA family metallohydrolase [Candidatus Palauibacterales bacterium]|nr:peptidase MA family metallohydrolase [Candidatus Palauibacterales bacterium]MDP2483708.1 peptidase MA family metallohydrolase [Candidatus Palauibacterales bacterium]
MRAGPVLLAAISATALTAAASPAVRPILQIAPGAPARVLVLGDPDLRHLGASLVADAALWKPFPGIGTLPDVGVDTLEIWLTTDLAVGVPVDVRHPESWVAGTADPSSRRVALRTGPGLGGPGGLRSVLRHEIAHVALDAATGGNYPRWLTEGYAQYASGEWSLEDAWQLQAAFLRRGATTLTDIDLRFRRHSTEARMGYLLSYTAVHELADLGGEVGLSAVFRRLGEGLTFEEALRRTYGISAEEFEARWKRSLVDRYGLLYLLSRAGVFWLAVTGLVLFVSLRRARRDRIRLGELRAEEAPDERLD